MNRSTEMELRCGLLHLQMAPHMRRSCTGTTGGSMRSAIILWLSLVHVVTYMNLVGMSHSFWQRQSSLKSGLGCSLQPNMMLQTQSSWLISSPLGSLLPAARGAAANVVVQAHTRSSAERRTKGLRASVAASSDVIGPLADAAY